MQWVICRDSLASGSRDFIVLAASGAVPSQLIEFWWYLTSEQKIRILGLASPFGHSTGKSLTSLNSCWWERRIWLISQRRVPGDSSRGTLFQNLTIHHCLTALDVVVRQPPFELFVKARVPLA